MSITEVRNADVWLMGIDMGAGSLKTMVVSSTGKVAGSASADIATRSPQPRWSEQDPAEWWQALCTTVPQALAQAGVSPDAIAAVSFSAGAHTPVLTDEAGKVLRPAILWSDQRSGDQVRRLQEKHGDRILAIALNRPTATWTMPQLLWLSENEPDVVKAARRLYVAKDWLRAQLTGDWVTDRTEAVGTLLFDATRNAWSQELCDMIGWDRSTLPFIVEPSSIVGHVTEQAARLCGLRAGTPVVCGTSDTSIETFGAGSVHAGDATIKLATAGTVSVVAEHPQVDPSLINYPLVVPGLWYTISGTNSCASAHRWLRDAFFMQPGMDGGAAFQVMDEMAATIAPGSEGLLFHPYLQGERAPYWDPLLRADFVGLTFAHGRAHLVRALYEGIAFALRDVMEQFRALNIPIARARIIGGGAHSAVWRQIVADIMNLDILLPRTVDASYGAALLAGVGVGVFANEQAAAACADVIATATPDPQRVAYYDQLFALYKQAQAGLEPVNHSLARLVAPTAVARSAETVG
jgi:xylulokinase